MTAEALKLSVYFGDRDRTGGHLLSDVLLDRYERHGLRTAILLRGIEGYNLEQQLRTQRILTLSEDLPLLSIAIDEPERIEAVLPDVSRLAAKGLVTVERARVLPDEPTEVPDEQARLSVYLARSEPYGAVVEALRAHGVDGATVFLGLDGMAHGTRRRARFLSGNADVPLLVVAVGAGEAIARALPDVHALLERPLATVERVRVCKRDGRGLAEPEHEGQWLKLTVYAGEQAHHDGRPVYVELVRRLRAADAGGATALRGIWGFSGDHAPHGDRLLALRRRVPVVTTVVDTRERIAELWPIVDELTAETGLVTSEPVPAAAPGYMPIAW